MTLEELKIVIDVDSDRIESDIRRASREVQGFGTESQRAEGVAGKAFKGISALAVAAGNVLASAVQAIAGAVISVGKSAVNYTMEFGDSMAKVSTIMDSTEMSSDDMKKSIKDLSSKMGIGASEIANSVYDVISATGDTANAVSLVEQASKLAKGGFAEQADATSVLTTAMNAYKMSADDVASISDSLIKTQNLGVTTVGELSQQMGKAIATGSAYNVNLHNLEAGYIALTKNGIQTAEATTYMSSMINELGDSGSSVSKILQNETGKSFGQLMSEGKSLGDVLSILQESVDGDSEAFMNLWSSAEAGKSASSIASQGFEEFNGWLGELQNSAGLTEQAFDVMNSTVSQKLEYLKVNVMNNLEGPINDILGMVIENLPAIQSALDESLGAFGNFVKENGEEIQTVINGIGSIIEFTVKASAGIMEFFGKSAKGYRDYNESMGKSYKKTSQGYVACNREIETNTEYTTENMKESYRSYGDVYIRWGENIKKKVDEMKKKNAENREAFSNSMRGIADSARQNWSSVGQSMQNAGNNIKNTLENLRSTASSKFSSIYDSARNKFNNVKTTVSNAVDYIRDKFANLRIKLPSIKLPHFKLTGSFSLKNMTVPKLSVSWYQKAYQNAYRFTQPTVLATASGYKGFGDGAGAEIVTGENYLYGQIGKVMNDAIGYQMQGIYRLLADYLPTLATQQIILDTGAMVGQFAPRFDDFLGGKVDAYNAQKGKL